MVRVVKIGGHAYVIYDPSHSDVAMHRARELWRQGYMVALLNTGNPHEHSWAEEVLRLCPEV